MRSEAPPLMPIFRSSHQAGLLAFLFLHPDEDHTLSDLARRLQVSLSALHREVERLVEADLIASRTVGRTRLLRANMENRVSDALAKLLTVTFGPQVVVEDEFADIPGARTVLIFGSWAARYHGETGPPPNDVDVLVLGEVDRESVYEAADRAHQRLELPVNPVIRPVSRWLGEADPLIQQVKSAPIVIACGDLPAEEG